MLHSLLDTPFNIHLGIHIISLSSFCLTYFFFIWRTLSNLSLDPSLPFFHFLFPGSKQSHCDTAETKEQSIGKEMTTRKELSQTRGKGRGREGASCRHLTSSDQNSEADEVDVKYASNKSPHVPSPKLSYASILLTPVALIIFPCSSCQHLLFTPPPTTNPISPFPLRPRVALCFLSICSVHPSFPLCSFLPLSLSPPPLSPRPLASSLSPHY